LFDRVASVVAGLAVLGLAGYLLVRNQAIASPQLFFALRVILSFGVATLGATIPGFLNVRWSGAGLIIRAGGALALFVLTFIYTPNVLANAGSDKAVVSAPNGVANGVAVGRDNNNSPITINPDVNTLSCRHPSHGVERYQRSFPVTMTSPEMGGGHSQPEWCNNAKATLAGQFPGGNFSVSGSSESTKNHCPPFNCPQYTYVCTLKVDADPVYKVAVGPECRQ
jgi:hypothetical protein